MFQRTIKVDEELYKEIIANLKSGERENACLRRLLGMPALSVKKIEGDSVIEEKGKDLIWKNVRLKHGSTYRMFYKEKTYKIDVQNGKFHCDGYNDKKNPSAMAQEITKADGINGWELIKYFSEGEYVPIQHKRMVDSIPKRSNLKNRGDEI